jgi:plastocyanin
MNPNYVIGFLVLVIVAGGVFFLQSREADAPSTENGTPPSSPSVSSEENPNGTSEEPSSNSSVTISYTRDGFSPKSITIDRGQTVIFTNGSEERSVWPASAMHPTHTVYPGSGIEKCGTDEASEIFDACKAIAPGRAYSFTFNEIGTWNYHDHLNPRSTGTIVVE